MPINLSTKAALSQKLFGETVSLRKKAVLIQQGGSSSVKFTPTDEEGNVILPSDYSSCKIRFSEAITHDIKIGDDVTPTSIDPSTGEILFSVPAAVQDYAGIYNAAFGFFNTSDKLIYTKSCYLYNEPSVWGTDVGVNSLPLIDELRMSIRDSDPIESELLGDHQFGLEEICLAVLQTIRLWNETPPVLYIETTKTFRHPYILKRGTQLFLYDFLLEWYRKNRLQYNAGGTQVDDMNKLAEYTQVLQMRYSEFVQLMQRTKAYTNLYSGFSKIG